MFQLVTCLLLLPSGLTLASGRGQALKRVRKTRRDDKTEVLENYDKDTLREMLERRAKQVGDVVLVNGKPAIIKKRPSLRVEKQNIKKKRVTIKSKARPRSGKLKANRLRKVSFNSKLILRKANHIKALIDLILYSQGENNDVEGK